MKRSLLLLGFALTTSPAVLAQNAVGELFSSDASVRGSVLLTGSGTRILSGSQVSAGEGAALLKLQRGGELRICPKTNLSLSSDADGRTLVMGLDAGAMELYYSLRSAADSLITPDFRLQLVSPGIFHLAISVAATGDTCVRSLPGNDASVFIAEMMGSDSYQLSPGKDVMFREGKISGAGEAPLNCGCPEAPPVEAAARTPARAATPPPVQVPEANNAAEQHMEVQGSFVYRGNEAPTPDIYSTVVKLSYSRDNSQLALALLPRVNGPAASAKPPEKKPGMLHRFGHFMGRLFGR